jgi:hypothetical protein
MLRNFRHPNIFIKQNDENLDVQKKLVKWTKAYFWATVVMAVAAGCAAFYTYNYTRITKDLLVQTRKDSALEFRPYVIPKPEYCSIDTVEDLADSIVYHMFFDIIYQNPGRTPAIIFRSAAVMNLEKEITTDTDSILDSLLSNTKVSTVLLGDVTANIGNMNFFLMTAKSLKIGFQGYYTHDPKNGWSSFQVNDHLEIIFYCHTKYRYSDLENLNTYISTYTLGIVVNFPKCDIKVNNDSYDLH